MRNPKETIILIEHNYPDFVNLLMTNFGYFVDSEESSLFKTFVFKKKIGNEIVRIRFSEDFENLMIYTKNLFDLTIGLDSFVVDNSNDTFNMLIQINFLLDNTLMVALVEKNKLIIPPAEQWPLFASN